MKKLIILCALCLSLSAYTHAQSWLLNGNNGTAATNFLGTKDSKALIFKTNNLERMRIQPGGNVGIGINTPLQKLDVNGNLNIRKGFFIFMDNHKVLRADSASFNTFIGVGVGDKGIGTRNTGTGFQALFSNTSGSYNTANGYQAMLSNSAGHDNVATGVLALYTNLTGSYNSAYGNYALFQNNTGSYNTANGYNALSSNTIGTGNVGMGYYAGYNTKTGGNNVSVGKYALYANTGESYNTAVGTEALYSNQAGYNVAMGYKSLYSNSTGYDNAAFGTQGLYLNTTGIQNTAMGDYALYSNTYGSYNTALGAYALFNTPVSSNNTAVGNIAGSSYQNGWNNTFIGTFADATGPDLYNSIAIGNSSRVTASNQVRVGNSFTNSIGGYAGWSTVSDGRVKKNIKDNVPGLAFINKLQPVTYNLDLAAADKFLQAPGIKENKATPGELSKTDLAARDAKQKIVYTGFIAQDVEKAARELGYDFSGVDAAKNDKDLYSLRYSEFVVPLVKAVQELSEKVEKLEAALAQKNEGKASAVTSKPSVTAGISLSQNTPNPFNNTTTINYVLPQQFNTAKIMVTNNSGSTIKEINLSGNGKGKITINASSLAAGPYTYAMYVDGKLAGSKLMMIVK